MAWFTPLTNHLQNGVILQVGIHGCLVYVYIPGAPMTTIFEGQSPKTSPFPTKTRVIWVLGLENLYIYYIYIYLCITHIYLAKNYQSQPSM